MTEVIIRHNGWSEYWDGESAQWVPVQDNSAPIQPTVGLNHLPGNTLDQPRSTDAGKKRPWFCHDGWTNR